MARIACPSCGSNTGLGEYICFKCGYSSNWRSSGIFETYEIEHATKKRNVIQLRDDVVLDPTEFSPKALSWLYRAGIYDPIIKAQLIGYCTTIDKVLIPAIDSSNDLKFYQLRSLAEDDDLKYITYGSTSQYSIKYIDHPESREIVICEDHLSGIRLRKFTNVLCLSGTSINTDTIKELLKEFDTFVFWLDADKPGRVALYKNLGRLKWYSGTCNTQRMFSNKEYIDHKFLKIDYKSVTKDPKFYLDNEIVNILKTKRVII